MPVAVPVPVTMLVIVLVALAVPVPVLIPVLLVVRVEVLPLLVHSRSQAGGVSPLLRLVQDRVLSPSTHSLAWSA